MLAVGKGLTGSGPAGADYPACGTSRLYELQSRSLPSNRYKRCVRMALAGASVRSLRMYREISRNIKDLSAISAVS